MLVNYYYSNRVIDNGGYDESDDLLVMCRGCASKHNEQVQLAQRGDEDSECEFCKATNNPQHSAELDRLFAQMRQA